MMIVSASAILSFGQLFHIGLFTFPLVLSQSQTPHVTCTGSNEYLDGKTGTCTVCPSTCPPGYGFFEHTCGNGEMKQDRCYKCKAGQSHNTADDENRCYPCKMCLNRQKITICTTTADANCGSCDDSYGWDQYREICKKCEDARTELPGCEKPPEVQDSEIHGRRLVCENVTWQSPPDQYSWYRNGDILDTSNENKFVTVGNMLLIIDPGIEDGGSYACSAKWNANNGHNFHIIKTSSNKVDLSIDSEEQYEEGNSEYSINNREFSTKEQYGETSMKYTTTDGEVSIKERNEDGNDEHTANATITVQNPSDCQSVIIWILWPVSCIICLFIPTLLSCLCNKMNCRNRCTKKVYQSQDSTTAVHYRRNTPLLCPESQIPGPVEVSTDTGIQKQSEKSGLLGELNDSSIQMESETDNANGQIAREPEEKYVEILYKTANECCSGLHYQDLDINTTDWLGVYLNPRIDPSPPVKFWRHLAHELGFTDQAMLNHLGSYKSFHDVIQTRDVSMGQFLQALWEVGNHAATKVVCEAIIKKHGNK